MIQRRTATGQLVQFPDGTSDDDMASAMDAYHADPANQPPAQASPPDTTTPATPYGDNGGWKPDTSPAHSQAIQDAYDKLPWYSQATTAAGDIARLAAHGFTGGVNNKFLGDLSGAFTGDYDSVYRQREQADADARIRAPVAGAAADALGFMSGVGKIMPGEQAVQAAPAIAASLPLRTIARAVLGGGENVAANAVANIGRGDLPQKDWPVAAGVGAGSAAVAAPLLTRTVGALADRFLPGMTINNPVPNTATLRGQKTAAYNVVDQHAPYAGADLRQPIINARSSMSGGPLLLDSNPPPNTASLHPGALRHITGLEDVTNPTNPGGWTGGTPNPTPRMILDRMKAIRRDTATNSSDATVAQPILDELGNVIDNTRTTAGALAGPSVDAANRANARYKNSQMLDRWHEQDLNTPNSANILPANARHELDTPDRRQYYNPAEISALQDVARGGPLAKVANFATSHPFVGPMAAGAASGLLTGSTSAGILGAMAYPIASMGGRAISRYSSNAAMNAARRTLTDTPANVGLASRALNTGPSRDQLNALMLGLYNQ